MKPTIGRIVLYRSRTGKYTVPAIITATKETLNPEGVANGGVPDLTADTNIHLTVFTPGIPGKRAEAADFEGGRKDAPISENNAGCYQEWDVNQYDAADAKAEQPAGTWMWPPRV